VRYPSAPGFAADSSTSRAAAADVAPEMKALHRVILWTLHNHGPLTADEIAKSVGRHLLTIRPRLTELRINGLVERTDDTRPSALGNNQHVMRLTDAGHNALQDRVNSFHVPNVAALAAEVTGQLTLVIP
jgi:predicted ArsR family transcriptional regulator